MWKIPDDVLWALREAAKPEGIMPNEASTASFLSLLAGSRYLKQSQHAPVWHITEAGREVLNGKRDLTEGDIAAIETLRRAMA